MQLLKQMRDKFKSYLFNALVKLLVFFPKFSIQCSFNAQVLIKIAIIYWCRVSNNSNNYQQEDEFEDELYSYAANEILELPGSAKLYPNVNAEQVEPIINAANERYKDEIINARSDFNQLVEQSSSIRKSISKIFDNDEKFNEQVLQTLTLCKKIKNKYNLQVKSARKIISDRRVKKSKIFPPSLDQVLKCIIPLASAVVFYLYVGGYVYIYTLFRSFGFDFTGFLNKSDYLVLPLGSVVWAFVYSMIIILIIYFSIIESARKHKKLVELDAKQDKYFIFPIMILALISFFLAGLLYRRVDYFVFFIGMTIILFLPSILNRYFHGSLKLSILIIFTIFFMVKIVSLSIEKYTAISSGSMTNQVSVYGKNNELISKGLVFVINDEDDYFYYDRESKSIIVIPRERISYIKSSDST